MIGYLIWRMVRIIVVLFLAVTFVFFLFRLVPGGLEYTLSGGLGTQAAIEKLRELLGLNKPLISQYGTYLKGLLKGDLGWTAVHNALVSHVISQRLPATFSLLGFSVALIITCGIPLGILSAATRRTYIMLPFIALYSIPYYVLGLFMVSLFSVKLRLLPSFGMSGLSSYLMPGISMAFPYIVVTARVTQASLSEVLHKEYVAVARAKGLPEWRIVMKHAFRNALLPIMTSLGMQAGYLLGGNVIVENVFSWPGIGQLIMESARARDYPVLQGITIFFTAGFLLLNLLVDLAYAALDPRVRYD